MDKITKRVRIKRSAAETFDLFTKGIHRWWPIAYTWSGHLLQEVKIDAKVGGFCTESGPHDYRVDWGWVSDLESEHFISCDQRLLDSRDHNHIPQKSSKYTLL